MQVNSWFGESLSSSSILASEVTNWTVDNESEGEEQKALNHRLFPPRD